MVFGAKQVTIRAPFGGGVKTLSSTPTLSSRSSCRLLG
jgi:hypothetical protein